MTSNSDSEVKLEESASSNEVTPSSSVVKLALEDFVSTDGKKDPNGQKVFFPQLSPSSMKKRKRESKLSTADCFEYVASAIHKVLLLSKNEAFRQKSFRTLEVDNAGDAKNVLKEKLNGILKGESARGVPKTKKQKTANSTAGLELLPVPEVKSTPTEEAVVKMEEEVDNMNPSSISIVPFD